MPKKWFRISFAEKAFLRLLEEDGMAVAELDVASGVAAMTDFYANHGAQHTAQGGEDVLRVSWNAHEATAGFSIARRMVRGDGSTGRELALRFAFDLAPWHSQGSAVYDDADTVRDLEVTRLASAAALTQVRLEFTEL